MVSVFWGCKSSMDVEDKFLIKRNTPTETCWLPICSLGNMKVDILRPYSPLSVDHWYFESKARDKYLGPYPEETTLFAVVGEFSSTENAQAAWVELNGSVDTILVKGTKVILVDEWEKENDLNIIAVTTWIEKEYASGKMHPSE